MPEVLTKHPDIVLEVLKGGGARCGPGQEQKILKACPPERFCATPTGETCVYGLEEIGQMTQISTADLAQRVCAGSQVTNAVGSGCTLAGEPASGPALVLAAAAALLLGRRFGKRRR